MQIPFVGAAYQARSSNIAADVCINYYPELSATPDAKTPIALMGCPGKRLLLTLPGFGGVRAVYTPTIGDMLAVQGSKLYRVTSGWVAREIGTLNTMSGIVKIKDNGVSAVIGDGLYGYTLDLATDAFALITDPDFYGSDCVEYLDNYFIFNRPGTQQFYISGIGDTTFDALDFASAEGAPDDIVTILVDHRDAWMFGSDSTEVFRNSGNADFPIERLDGSFIEHGCAAKHSPAKMDNTVYWLGRDERGSGVIWKAQGYTPIRVSTHAIEFAIQGYEVISDAFATTYQQEGHSFYCLTFPTADKTLVYDASTNMWHERAWRDPATGALGRDRTSCHTYFGGEHVVGDWENGKVYALDLEYYSDDGDPMPAIRATGHITNADDLRMVFDEIQIQMETGVGLQTGQGSDPVGILDWSDDGGHTWSNGHTISIGRVGIYSGRARLTRMGMSRDRVYRWTITDPVKRVIMGAHAKIRTMRR